ncbi:30396_t:CDS:2, partial [Gigaspora margarita]
GNLDEWEFRCPKWSGGCGRLHALNVDELDGELDSIEPTHGYDYAEVVEMVREEWQEYYQQQYLQEIGESEEQEKQNNQQEKIKAGVKLEERQYEKEAGGFRPVGFYKQRQEIFVCGNCSKNLAGAKRHGRAKNRNNPVF